MEAIRAHLDPAIRSFDAFGVADPSELLDAPDLAHGRSEPLPRVNGRERLRFPLPGTPTDSSGTLTGAPRGAGTGWVVLERWTRVPWSRLLHARLTQPRSASVAERTWNLLCHLRRHGVGAPRPLAVGARGRGFVSRQSFLLTAELANAVTLPEWLETETRPRERALGLRSVGVLLAKLLDARVRIAGLDAAHLVVQAPRAGRDACAEESEPSACDAPTVDGFELNRMPSVVLTEVTGAVLVPFVTNEELATMLVDLDRTSSMGSPVSTISTVSNRDRARVLSAALSGFDRARRARVLAALRARGSARRAD